MTDSLTAIKARLAQATPGKWDVHTYPIGFPWESKKTVIVDKQRLLCDTNMKPADAEFIAHAPTDLAYLLTRLKAAEQCAKLLLTSHSPNVPCCKEHGCDFCDALTTWEAARG